MATEVQPYFKDFYNIVKQYMYALKKPNLFLANFTLPDRVLGNLKNHGVPTQTALDFLVSEIPIPSISVKTITIPLNGIDRTFALSRDIEKQVEFTFFDDEYNHFKNTINAWMEVISFGDNYFVSFKSDYAGTLEVYSLDKQLNKIKKYTFKNIYPVNIERTTYSYQSENTINTVIVTMAVDSVVEDE